MPDGDFRSFTRSEADLHEFGLTMDHLGLVAGMCDELEIISIIEQQLDNTHPNMNISSGQASMAIILNMLNVLQHPLMLAPEFMEKRPIDRLITGSDQQAIMGEHEITAEHFNQHVLGRTLDRLYDHGLEELFMTIAGQAYQKFKRFTSRFLHTDTTSMSVHGSYDDTDDELIKLTYGFSKDGNHNLKQFLISMICCDRLPLFLSTASGNTSDKKYFNELVVEYGNQIRDQFGDDKIFVFDSAYFTDSNLNSSGKEIDWITRVPYTITESKELKDKLMMEFDNCQDPKLDNYAINSIGMSYAEIDQRWIVVQSNGKLERDKKSLQKKISKEEEAMASSHSIRNKLQRMEFDSQDKCMAALSEFQATLKYHRIASVEFEEKVKRTDGKRGRIGEDTPTKIVYSPVLTLKQDPSRIAMHLITAGRFIIATNVSSEELSDEEVLLAFKSQQNVERGFRFLKDPFFFARSIFLEKPERISALAMLMGISLLIYNLCELRLREALHNNNEKFEDPSLGPNENPTIRRVFQTFQGIFIHYTTWKGELVRENTLNIKPWHIQVINLLGEIYYNRYKDGIYLEEKYFHALKSGLSDHG